MCNYFNKLYNAAGIEQGESGDFVAFPFIAMLSEVNGWTSMYVHEYVRYTYFKKMRNQHNRVSIEVKRCWVRSHNFHRITDINTIAIHFALS